MKVSIIAVGTELLFGKTVNTNASYLSSKLNDLGFDVMYHHTVGDNPQRLKDMVNLSFKDCDMVITTGGLGPTQDDMTKEILCELFGDELVLHEPSMDRLQEIFKKMKNYIMTENNFKQAYMPSKGIVLANRMGSAPGCIQEKDGKIAICLPGPPREMKTMFEEQARPYLEKKSESSIVYKFVRTFGIGESDLETRLLDLINEQTDPTLATYVKEGETYLRVASKRSCHEEAEAAVNEMIEKIVEKVGEFVYDCDNTDLADVVGRKLLERNISISSAESCTAGMFAARLADIPGISDVFDRGLVTYSNEAKIQELGVKAETLEKYGAVSEETAIEMARGLSDVSGSDVCVSVTGYAGPDSPAPDITGGLIYICVIYNGKQKCREVRTRDLNRKWNRNYAMLCMFDMVNKILG